MSTVPPYLFTHLGSSPLLLCPLSFSSFSYKKQIKLCYHAPRDINYLVARLQGTHIARLSPVQQSLFVYTMWHDIIRRMSVPVSLGVGYLPCVVLGWDQIVTSHQDYDEIIVHRETHSLFACFVHGFARPHSLTGTPGLFILDLVTIFTVDRLNGGFMFIANNERCSPGEDWMYYHRNEDDIVFATKPDYNYT